MLARPNVLGMADPEQDDPPGYRGAEVHHDGRDVGKAAGGSELNVRSFELPSGQSLCPYHYEYVEEWLLVLDGELELRTPEGNERLTAGALACFPSGPEGAHKVTAPTDTERPARFIMFSSAAEPCVAVYPDSDKVGIFVPGRADNMLFHRPAENAEYFDGELGG